MSATTEGRRIHRARVQQGERLDRRHAELMELWEPLLQEWEAVLGKVPESLVDLARAIRMRIAVIRRPPSMRACLKQLDAIEKLWGLYQERLSFDLDTTEGTMRIKARLPLSAPELQELGHEMIRD